MGIVPKGGHRPRAWASAPHTPAPGEAAGVASSMYELRPCMFRPLPDRWLGWKINGRSLQKNTPRILRARLNLPLSCASPASCMNNPFHTAPSPCIVAHSPTRREQTTYRPFTLHGCYAKKSATSHQESGHQHDREQASCNCHRWPRLPAASSCIARQHHH